MTTEVSRSPWAFLVIESLIDHGIKIRPELRCIDSRRSRGRLCQTRPWHKSFRSDGPQLSNRCAVTSNDNRLASLYVAKNGSRLISELALVDHSLHSGNV